MLLLTLVSVLSANDVTKAVTQWFSFFYIWVLRGKKSAFRWRVPTEWASGGKAVWWWTPGGVSPRAEGLRGVSIAFDWAARPGSKSFLPSRQKGLAGVLGRGAQGSAGDNVDRLVKWNNLECLPSQNTSDRNKVCPLLPELVSFWNRRLAFVKTHLHPATRGQEEPYAAAEKEKEIQRKWNF